MMHAKHLCLTIFLLMLTGTGGTAQQQNPQLIFNQANEQLQEGNITEALGLYRRLEERKQLSGALFLNMGLGYARINSMGKAKYYFLKAQQFDATEDEAREALAYVERRFSHQSAVLPELPWQQALNWLSEKIGSAMLLAIGLVIFNLGVIAFIAHWFVGQSLKIWSRSALATAGLGMLIVLLSFYTDYRQQRYQKAVMITQEAGVLEQPAPEAAMVNQAFEGYTFIVDQAKSSNQNDWSYIRMSNGQYGWIPSSEIMIL